MSHRVLKSVISNRLAWCGWVVLIRIKLLSLFTVKTSHDPKKKMFKELNFLKG